MKFSMFSALRRLPTELNRVCWLTLAAGCGLTSLADTNFSAWVYPAPDGRLLRQPDALGNRVLDYTTVGYQGGAVPLPLVRVKVTISPVPGDDGASIQAAINLVSALPLDTNGFRGAVLLTAGEYQISNSITINASGVVLRGVGNATSGTVLRAAGPGQRSLVRITGSGSPATVGGTTHNLTDVYVPVGATSFRVDNTAGLAPGDRVFVRRNANQQWIDDLGMNLLDNPWTPSGYTIDFDRIITRIEGNRIFINAPLTCAIEQKYGGGTIRKYTWSARIRNVGVENLRGVSDFVSSDDEDHGWILIQVNSAEQVWVRDVVSQYFGYACVALYNGTRFATVQDCSSLDPVSIVTGGRRYAFVMDDCQMCLVKDCYTDQDRHQFVTQSLTTGPNVFVDGRSDVAKSDCGPHHRWGTGALWDNVTVNGNSLDVQNRGNLGTGHGWSGANEVVWNCFASGGYVVQNPPTARNWLIGSIGPIKNGTVYVGPHDPGTYDSPGTNVFPNSLYYTELQDRLAAPKLETREYWLGDIDAFTNTDPAGETVPVDPAWLASVQAAAGTQPVQGFDIITNGHWVPFTFNFALSGNEHIVAATLQLSMRSVLGGAGDVLYLDSVTNAFTFSSLGWNSISTTTNPAVRVLDLSDEPGLLADGKFNVATRDDVGIDWAMLELQVATNLNAGWFSLTPAADATVRGGASANSNFGTDSTLTVKADSAADYERKAYMRWDLSSVTGAVYEARIRLTPVSVGTNGIEQGAAIATNDAWSETGITWNTQPGAATRFTTWIPGTNGPVEFVVTPQVLGALAGDRQVTVQLYSLHNVGGAGLVDFASREATDPASRPQLLLLVSNTPPSISGLTNRSIPVNASTGPIPFVIGDDKTAASDLLLAGASSNTNLVPDANIVFGGSGSNRTVTVTPAANQSGLAAITVKVTDDAGLSSSDSFTLTVSTHPPGIYVWNGPGPGVNDWSAGGNWLPTGPPEALDEIKFFDPGSAGVTVSNTDNFVDPGFGGTVASLQYGNTNGNHTTLIGPGRTLTVSGPGGLTVGTETDNGSAQVVAATITGAGGALRLQAPEGALVVRQGSASSGSHQATLDLSGLGSFSALVGQVLVGCAGPVNRAAGTLYLGRTNLITVTGLPGICAGDNHSNSGGQDFVYLGQTNFICADSIAIARQKATATLKFNPAFPNSFARVRAANGWGRVADWEIGDHSLQSASSSSSVGTNDFSGGTVDAQVDTMVLGRSQKTTGADSRGVLTFDAGTIDVNTLQVGFQTQSGATSAGVGVVNVNGPDASLLVNSVLELGHTSGGTGANNTFGTLNINGGTVTAASISVGSGSGPDAIQIDNGTLKVTDTAGTAAQAIPVVALANSALELQVSPGAIPLATTNLITAGPRNTINVVAAPLGGSFPARYPLITYHGSIGGAGYNFVLGTLPEATVCGGYLSNNAANGSVDLVLTNCVMPDPFLTWNGDLSGSWDTTAANWKNNVSAGLVYAQGDAVVFNDLAAGATNIFLTTALTPASLTISNSAKTFSFTGPGGLSGATALQKRGPGTLILANAGLNDFGGGVFISDGTLQVGNGGSGGSLPGGLVENNGSLVFNLGENRDVAGVISGSGSLIQAGNNVLTLGGANTLSGPVTVRQGTLKMANGSALGTASGVTTVTNAGTLDINGFNLGAEPIVVSGGGGTNGGAIINSGAQQTSALRSVTLAGNATFGGTGRWDIRNSGGTASLLTGGHAFRITKVGPNQVSLVGVDPIDPALADVDIQEGTFAVQTTTAQLGNPNSAIIVRKGATLNFWNLHTTPLNKRIIVEDGGTLWNESGDSVVVGQVALAAGRAIFDVGGASLTFSNAIGGAGGLTKTDSGVLALHATNPYLGDTVVNSGTLELAGIGSIGNSAWIELAAGTVLDVTGREDGVLTLTSGQLLEGDGAIRGSLTVGAGSTVSPGESIGTLTVSNAVSLSGTTIVELDASAHTNDALHCGSELSYGGTLSLTNLSGSLSAGDSFPVFSAATFSGSFSRIDPPMAGPGLVWDVSALTSSGTLRVAVAPRPELSIRQNGTNFVVAGWNGIAGAEFYILASTNLALPLATWNRVATNRFDNSGAFVFPLAAGPNPLPQFYLLQIP